jgi:cytochrome c
MRRPAVHFLLPALLAFIAGCSKPGSNAPRQRSASELMIQYGCVTCHVIPGVPGAVGKVGPELDDLNDSSFIAGSLPNTPRNLQLWIMHPQRYRPGVAMPEMGVDAQNAATIAEFLEQER